MTAKISAAVILAFLTLGAASSNPAAAQDDTDGNENKDIVIETDLVKELDDFCVRAMETVADERPVRAARLLSDHAKRLTRRMRRGADAYFRVTSIVEDRDGQHVLTIAEVLGTNDRIRAVRAGGEKLHVTLADDIGEVSPGDIIQIKGKPIFVSSTSYDDAEYVYGAMDLKDTQIAVKATCEGNAAVILLFDEPVVSRVLTEEERKAIQSDQRDGIR